MKLQESGVLVLGLLLGPGLIGCADNPGPVVDEEKCEGCETCVGRCQLSAITMKDELAQVDLNKCFGCGACVVTCPADALSMKLVRPIEHITG